MYRGVYEREAERDKWESSYETFKDNEHGKELPQSVG